MSDMAKSDLVCVVSTCIGWVSALSDVDIIALGRKCLEAATTEYHCGQDRQRTRWREAYLSSHSWRLELAEFSSSRSRCSASIAAVALTCCSRRILNGKSEKAH
ncbi:hypothetical protein PHLGIDRAFT_467729 [Phlebiopsis gigantea 11061_1 CR5-6]|uniref:Uncharacterized protein n=1 Tax=Phlebiopsis gigantea (strain 11061_1 CR5-6) TaxID=745531 RepID=A0A0C3S6G9_PHLG1|nr:hypothetical protein PHLGIDRAFT_467729 [Phlebiopsis gigantea 11061_1 CR5-6]